MGMADFLFRLVLGFALGIFITVPVSLFVFIYGLVVRRSLSEAARGAGEAFIELVGKVWSETA